MTTINRTKGKSGQSLEVTSSRPVLPNIHNFTGFVWSEKGLRQVKDLIRKAIASGHPESGEIETLRQGMRQVVARANGMVS